MTTTVEPEHLEDGEPTCRRAGPVHPHAMFTRIAAYSPRNHVHEFRLTALSEIDATFRRWVAEAYRVGGQRHLARRASSPTHRRT